MRQFLKVLGIKYCYKSSPNICDFSAILSKSYYGNVKKKLACFLFKHLVTTLPTVPQLNLMGLSKATSTSYSYTCFSVTSHKHYLRNFHKYCVLSAKFQKISTLDSFFIKFCFLFAKTCHIISAQLVFNRFATKCSYMFLEQGYPAAVSYTTYLLARKLRTIYQNLCSSHRRFTCKRI